MATPERKARVILSDHFLKREAYKRIMQRICEKKLKNIVIIGGSHSGFSSAWLILNGPASYKEHNVLQCKKWDSFPESHKYQNVDCSNC